MDRKEKAAKKARISEDIDLSNGRYKDEEVNTLFEFVTQKDSYDGLERTLRDSYDGWSSDGKYHRDTATTYRFVGDSDGLRIEEHSEYHDDDGQHGEYDASHTTGRDILNIFKNVFS